MHGRSATRSRAASKSSLSRPVGRVETELRVTDAGALFVVRTDDPGFRDVLPGLAYGAVDDAFARTFPADAPDLERIYRTFERHIEELLEQTAGRRRVRWEDALNELAARLASAGIDWFVIGSAALALRGIGVEPRDVDFVTTDHARVAAALADALIEPPLYDSGRDWIARWFGRAYLGARVEWVAEVYPDYDDWGAPNEIGPTAAKQLERVRWNGRSLAVSPLDIQLAVNEKRGLEDRVDAIRRFVERTPA
jgi:hypothetical protein